MEQQLGSQLSVQSRDRWDHPDHRALKGAPDPLVKMESPVLPDRLANLVLPDLQDRLVHKVPPVGQGLVVRAQARRHEMASEHFYQRRDTR